VCFDGCNGVVPSREGGEECIRMGGHALRCGGLRGGCAAFATSAHGAEVREAGFCGHGGVLECRLRKAMGSGLKFP
jgi:hypothetical protein